MKKQYVYLNNHFAAQAVADAAVLRHLLDEPVDGADARRARVALSDARRQSRYFAPFTVALMMRSPTASLSTTSIPEMTLPKTVYLPSRRGWLGERHVELAVGLRGVAGVRHGDGAATCACAASRTRRRRSTCRCRPCPTLPSCVMSRDCGSPIWTTKLRHDAVHALAVVEALLHQPEDVRDGLRRLVRDRSRTRTCPSRSRRRRPGRRRGLSRPLAPEPPAFARRPAPHSAPSPAHANHCQRCSHVASTRMWSTPSSKSRSAIRARRLVRDTIIRRTGLSAYSDDAELRTLRGQRAVAASRIDRPADVLAPGHQIQIDVAATSAAPSAV